MEPYALVMLVGLAAQAAIVAFVLWPVYRIVRKAGYGRRYAWILCVICAGCSLGTSGLATLLMQGDRWIEYLDTFSWAGVPGGAMLVLVFVKIVFSPIVFGVIPLIYFTFQKWPLEGRGKEPDIFG